jgi:C4-dicarboxylate transporter, DctQ subunit
MDAEGTAAGEVGRESASPPRGWVGRIAVIGGWISALLVLIILALTAVSVVFRYLFSTPIRGVDEATGYFVVAIVAFGAADALRRGDHIGIDILTERLSAGARRVLDRIGLVFVVGFALVLLWTAWHTVSFSWSFGLYSNQALRMPMWIPQSALIPGAILLALVALAKLIERRSGK